MQIVATAVEIPVNAIVAGDNDRTTFPAGHIERLAASIAAEGLHQPITVRPLADGRYQIVAGECRWRAHQHMGAATIPAIVKPMDDRAASLAMLSENLQRQQLDPMDEARAFAKRRDSFGMSAEEIGKWANVSADLVKRRLALLDLLPDIQQQIKAGALSLGHAEALAGLDRNNQIAALRALTTAGSAIPTVATFRKICGELLAQQQQQTMFDLDSLWREKLAEAEAEKPKRGRKADAEQLAAARAELAAAQAELRQLRLEKQALALHKRIGKAMRASADPVRLERLSFIARRAMARYERRAS